MIPQKSKNNGSGLSGIRLLNEPYLFINLFFAGVLLVVFTYSLIFSPDKDNYPVVCIHEKITGQPCISCGLSHSMSLILRGKITEASEWNIYGLRVFIFFVSQLLLRIFLSLYYVKFPSSRKWLIIMDSAGSGLMFLLTFWPFVRWMGAVL
jgi:hypothetical protein